MSTNEFQIERSITIHAPATAIYPMLVDFHRWTDWSPWEGLDPDLSRDYSGPSEGVGSKYAWSGNRKAGQGSMEITGASAPTAVTVALSFVKPFKANNTAEFTLTEAGDSTTVRWLMHGPQSRLLKVMSVVFNPEKMVGPDFEKGLAALKARAEATHGVGAPELAS